jgi:DNA repair protein RadD
MPVNLRPYQQAVREGVINQFRNDVRRVLIVMPTGAGKGTTSTDIIESTARKGNSCLFIVNRTEIVRDQSRRLDRLGIDHGIIMSGHPRRKPTALVHIASKDTLQRRVQKGNRPYADLIFIDECHFAVSDGWRELLEHYSDTFVIGMTATPVRLDGRGLGEFFDVIVEGPTITELQEMGFLVRTRVYGSPLAEDVSLKGINKSGGDLNNTQLQAAFDKPHLIGDIVDHWKRLGEDSPTVVFAVNKAHSEHIRDEFLAAGITAVAVDADTPPDTRDATWEELRTGRVKVVCSVGIISYGWDVCEVRVAILARRTESLALYLQQVGRVLRPSPGKPDAIILDHCGNTMRHGFVEDPREWSLTGVRSAKSAGDVKGESVSTCKNCWMAFRASLRECPACGTERERKELDLKVVEGQLQELKRGDPIELHEKFIADPRVADKYKFLVDVAKRAHEKNYKPGYAAMQFHAKFNQFPAKSLKDAARAAAERGL